MKVFLSDLGRVHDASQPGGDIYIYDGNISKEHQMGNIGIIAGESVYMCVILCVLYRDVSKRGDGCGACVCVCVWW